MKNTLIDEIVSPLEVVLENLSDPEDIAHMKVAIQYVRGDLDKLFGDLFEPEDIYDNGD